MELLFSGLFTLVGFALFGLWVYSFVLLWGDEKLKGQDMIKILGTVLFLAFWPAAWVYLIYRMFRS